MKRFYSVMLVTATLAAAGCKGNDAKVDDALNGDLSMAGRPYNQLDSVSAAERSRQTSRSSSSPTRTRSSTSSSSSSARSSGPIDHVEKHPGRDAAIGAGAGAVLGAATSKDKVKGGLIGAAAGGLIGAVIGNNVDKKKVPNK